VREAARDDIQWTTQLGDAFLDQQSDVMDAVQRMRKKAEEKGALKSNEQQKVETKVVEEKTVIVVEQTESRGRLRPFLQSDGRLPAAGLPYPPVYYPPYARAPR
jgi:DNA helicase IV